MTAAPLDADALALAGAKARMTSLMLVGLNRRSLLRLAPALGRHEVELVEADCGESALARCAARRFDLVVVRHPIDNLSVEEFLIRLRRPEGRSHRAYALVMTDRAIDPAIDRLSGSRSRFVNSTDFDTILSVISRQGLWVAPRVDVRVTVRLGLRMSGEEMTRFCQVRNLSESGMLIRIAERPGIGDLVNLLLNLPSVPRPLELDGQVVRHTGPREVEGIALRFVGLGRETRGHLRRYIQTQRAR